MSTYSDHLQSLRSISRTSARKAVDFLNGDQLSWLESLLSTNGRGIKNWQSRGVFPIWEDLTRLIIEKSAQTYQNPPERVVFTEGGEPDEDATAFYAQLLKDGGFKSTADHADELTRLLKTSLVLVQWNSDKGRLYFEVLSQDNCDVDYDRVAGEFKSLLYAAGTVGPNGGETYYYWTPEVIQTYELTGDLTKIGADEPNPYGIIPLATLWDIKPPRVGFWSPPVWEQLVCFNEAVNLFHTETKFNQRYGSIGSPVTNRAIAEGTVFGPDAVVQLDDENPDIDTFFEYKAPQVQVDDFLKWMDSAREHVGQDWGVNVKIAGEGAADSGFKLIVEELPTLQLRKKRLNPAIDFEEELYVVVATVMLASGSSKTLPPGSSVNVVFPAPDLPVNDKEKWEIAQGKMASKVLSRKQYLKDEHPDWTDEQVDAEILAIDASFGAVPDFSGVVSGES